MAALSETQEAGGSKYHCVVPLCNDDGCYKNLMFYRFPSPVSRPELRKQWIAKIRRDEGDYFEITDSTSVCEEHFLEEKNRPGLDNLGRKRLKTAAIPTQFAWHRPKARQKIERHIQLHPDESESGSSDCQTEKKAKREDIHPDEPNVKEQLDAARAEIRHLKAQVEALKLYKFSLERFSMDNDSIKFCTGFVSYQYLVTFYEIVKPSAESMQYCYTSSMSSNPPPGGRTMVLIGELFLFLLRIRLGLLQQDLAHRFNVHESTVSRKVITYANYLYFFLGAQPIWPSKEAVQKHLPQEFRVRYPNTRVVIDCMEIRVQVPSSLLLQS
ncbi:unnamed protein product [Porites evermanni]|uniref:THAP-type domain-containing protein n=1 Tax=Porites evermanni TaxID=104178 RepID=A0ABN8RIA6_9CNID|nr:unnamed protein product [Porites evermanni]